LTLIRFTRFRARPDRSNRIRGLTNWEVQPMKTHKLAGSICALLLTVLGASSAVAQTSTASILFMREFDQPGNSNAYGIRLGRVQPSGEGVAWLTPLIYGVSFHGDGWSPQGAAVVYERSPLGRGTSQLYVVNRQGGNVRQITTGPTDNTRASWGPNGIIAFVNRDNEIDDTTSRDCLATVRPDGTQQHIVFCPPRPPGAENSTYVVMSEPQWSADGKCVYVVTGTDDGNAQPRKWFSDAYRVNVATGTAVRLTRQVFTEAINVRRPWRSLRMACTAFTAAIRCRRSTLPPTRCDRYRPAVTFRCTPRTAARSPSPGKIRRGFGAPT
jgi:hypothetical protein